MPRMVFEDEAKSLLNQAESFADEYRKARDSELAKSERVNLHRSFLRQLSEAYELGRKHGKGER